MPDRAALITAVLEELMVLGTGEEASAEDVAAVDSRLDPVLASLEARGVIGNPDPGDVGPVGGDFDPAAFNHLVACVADACGPKFGRGRNAGLVLAEEEALRTIARANKGARRRLVVDAAVRPCRR